MKIGLSGKSDNHISDPIDCLRFQKAGVRCVSAAAVGFTTSGF